MKDNFDGRCRVRFNLTEIIEEMRSDEGGIVGIKKMSESDRFAHIEMPVV